LIIAGIDYSLGCPAIFVQESCYFRTSIKKYARNFVVGKYEIYGSLHENWASPAERYGQLASWVEHILESHKVTNVYLEDYSYGSKGKVFEIGENTGVLKYVLWKSSFADVTLHLVSPTAVKKFATGKGSSDKWGMMEAFEKKTGYNIHNEITPDKETGTSPSSDIVDSFWILKYGEHDALSRNKPSDKE